MSGGLSNANSVGNNTSTDSVWSATSTGAAVRNGNDPNAAGFLGVLTEKYGIENTYLICSFMPFAGLMVWFLPRMDNKLK